jgi:hypothetical protein
MEKLHFKVWLEDKESKQDKVRNLIDGQNLILFFTKGDNLFGAPEESRLVFAKMKSPDDDMPDGWADDANFAAFDLMKALVGDRVENMFGKKDMKQIKIIDPEDAHSMLMKSPNNIVKTVTDALKTIGHSKHGANMLKLKDKK